MMTTETIRLEGVCNFRDLGGIATRDGRTVKRGRIFRTDEMSRLTDEDLRRLAGIPLRTLVDLRTEGEIRRRPNREPASLRHREICPLDTPRCLTDIAGLHDDGVLGSVGQDVQDMLGKTDAKIATLPEDHIRTAMIRLYERFSTEPDFVDVYRRIFGLLLRDDAVPLVFHCMAGKDRTGIVAALILSALDVDEETLLRDYLLSNVVLEKRYAEKIALNSALRYLYGAHAEFLQAALDTIRNDHGSITRYLRETLGVDTEEMKERYTEAG